MTENATSPTVLLPDDEELPGLRALEIRVAEAAARLTGLPVRRREMKDRALTVFDVARTTSPDWDDRSIGLHWRPVPNYARDAGAADALLRLLRPTGAVVMLDIGDDTHCEVRYNHNDYSGSGAFWPEALARAFLAAAPHLPEYEGT